MNDEKLSTDMVPQKFAEWLLAMGCPPEKVPPEDKIAAMCRGQFYMVWRSLMEHVEAKDTICQKRLQVFCDDIKKCQKKKAFESDSSVIVPQELILWQQKQELQKKVSDAECRVTETRTNLDLILSKISSKLSHRNTLKQQVQDTQRRSWLLQQVAQELQDKKANLLETKTIADSLCCVEDVDIESKLDKYLSGASGGRTPNAAAYLSLGDHDTEEHASSLLRCRGDAVWPLLCSRRAALCAALASYTPPATTARVTPQAVLAQTAGMHCQLALEAYKNKINIKQTRKKLAAAVAELSSELSGESCELLVVCSERAHAEARVGGLRALLRDVTARALAFRAEPRGGGRAAGGDRAALLKRVADLNKHIESTVQEIRRLDMIMATTERKTANVRDCLLVVFKAFQNDTITESDKYKGQVVLPQVNLTTLRQFYVERQERRNNNVELSLNLDVSDNDSFNNAIDYGNPKFSDELKIYLRNFHLEKNKKIVLESGEKVWVFESVESSLQRLRGPWSAYAPCSARQTARRAASEAARRADLARRLQHLETTTTKNITLDIDITPRIEEEQQITDKIKKRLNEILISLQRTSKKLDIGQDNLQLWAENTMRKYINTNRTVDGKTYKEYEAMYIDNLSLNL